jgi:pyruvate ferredoxin oxidoreductase alpha subunit
MAMSGLSLRGYTVIAGLGGRSITKASLRGIFDQAGKDELPHVTFLDLNWDMVNRQLERERQHRKSGPTAENLLKDLGTVAARIN